MNQKIRKVSTALLLSGAMVCSSITPALAADTVDKEETVYVKTDANGNEDTVIVSDWLKNPTGASTISDQSDLKDIENVKGKESFKQGKDDAITWSANGNDIYYQGTTDKQLPVSVSVTYFLDDKEIQPKDLIGKSGKVRIRYDYTNHSAVTRTINGKEATLYTPFTMVTAAILTTDHFSNVKVTNGKVISDGSKHVVTGVAMPGLSESLNLNNTSFGDNYKLPDSVEITADAKDFQMTVTATVATSNILSDFGFDDIDSIDDLTSSLNELSDASSKLVKGSDDLYDGVTKLATASKTLKNGTKTLAKSTKDLKDGLGTISNGSQTLKSGTATLATKTKDLPASVKQIDDGVKEILKSVNAGMPNEEQLKQLQTTLTNAQTSITTSMTDMANQTAALGALAQDPSASIGTAERQKLGKIATAYKKDLTTMESNLKTISSCLTTINKQLGQTLTSTKELQKALTQLSNGTGQLLTASKTLKTSIGQVKKGASDLNSGISSAASGSKKLSKGATKLDNGTGELVTGIGTLKKGSNTLKNGMQTFNKTGITPLVDLVNNDVADIAKRAEETIKLGNEYESFTKISDNMDGSVKFMIETAELEK